MKIGNTDFNTEAIKKMSFEDFEKSCGSLLRGHNLKDVFLKLGGKITQKPKEEATEEKPKKGRKKQNGDFKADSE